MGNASRGLVRGPGLSTWDLSLNKDTVMPFYGEVPFAWFTKHLGDKAGVIRTFVLEIQVSV